jgi:electron transfer flavoprotein alpha subunit
MGKILVIAEHSEGKVKKTTHELLGAASSAGQTVEALLIGASVKGLANDLASYGAGTVYVCESA